MSRSGTPEAPDADDPAIVVDDLTFRYPGGDRPVLEGANLTVEPGAFTAIVGGNGSGKSTLCKTFNGLVPHLYEGTFEGSVTVGGVDTREATVGELSRQVGYVFQDFENQLVQPRAGECVAAAPLNHGLADHEARAEEALAAVGCADLADRFVWELSGGQQHLVALASALALDPAFVVVDEPAAQLDPRNARETYERLRALHKQGTTVVVVEHHTEFVAEYADRVALVADGGVAWTAPTAEALNRLEDLRREEIHPPGVTSVARRLGDAGRRPDGRFPVTVEEAEAVFAGLATGGPDEWATGAPEEWATGSDADDATPADPVVALDGVTHGYRTLREGRTTVLDDLDLAIGRGERVALVGANGAGKSTLLRLVTGLEAPDAGSVSVLGRDTAETLPEELAEDAVYVHQHPEETFVRETVRDDVAHYLRSRDHPDTEARVDEVLDYLGLTGLAERDGRLLSTGQQRRASLAVGLATDPSLVLLDEPTGSLDLQSRREVTETLERAGDRVETVVVATHDLQLVASWSDRVVVLGDGAVLADGPPREVFARPAVLEQADLRPPATVELSSRLGIDPPALTVAELAARLGAEDAGLPTDTTRGGDAG